MGGLLQGAQVIPLLRAGPGNSTQGTQPAASEPEDPRAAPGAVGCVPAVGAAVEATFNAGQPQAAATAKSHIQTVAKKQGRKVCASNARQALAQKRTAASGGEAGPSAPSAVQVAAPQAPPHAALALHAALPPPDVAPPPPPPVAPTAPMDADAHPAEMQPGEGVRMLQWPVSRKQ